MAKNVQKLQMSLDLRIVSALLLIIIIVMLAVWRPWSPQGSERTVEVTGEATQSAEPDEYVFYPTYNFTNNDKAAGLDELSKKSDEVVNKLKDLGVAENKIKTNSSGYEKTLMYAPASPEGSVYSLQLTVKVNDQDLSQKVQDYLLTTSPSGSVSPQATFSDSKRKELENKARDDAAADARNKADQSAKKLGFKVGKVKAVSDGAGFGEAMPMTADTSRLNVATSAGSSGLTVLPGENELTYSVTVTYFIR